MITYSLKINDFFISRLPDYATSIGMLFSAYIWRKSHEIIIAFTNPLLNIFECYHIEGEKIKKYKKNKFSSYIVPSTDYEKIKKFLYEYDLITKEIFSSQKQDLLESWQKTNHLSKLLTLGKAIKVSTPSGSILLCFVSSHNCGIGLYTNLIIVTLNTSGRINSMHADIRYCPCVGDETIKRTWKGEFV